MQIEVRGERGEDSGDLLYLMGRGNHVGHAGDSWFVDELVTAGFRVHAVELPTNGTDFDLEYRDPVQAYLDQTPITAVLGYSLGGLVAAHVETAVPRVFVSPFWRLYGSHLRKWQRALFPRIPSSRQFIPTGERKEWCGHQLTDSDCDARPDPVSPRFLKAMCDAQRSLPELGPRDWLICSLGDIVVGLDGMDGRIPIERIRLFTGGHEPFAVESRNATTAMIVETLREELHTSGV